MEQKAKSVQIFEVLLWSKKYYNRPSNRLENIYDGQISNKKTGECLHFHTPSQFMAAIENMFKTAEEKDEQEVKQE